MFRAWNVVVLECVESSTLSLEELSLRFGSMTPSQSPITRRGFSHLARPYWPGGFAFFALEMLDFYLCDRISNPRVTSYRPDVGFLPVRQDFQSKSDILSSPDLAELQCSQPLQRFVSTFCNDVYRGSDSVIRAAEVAPKRP